MLSNKKTQHIRNIRNEGRCLFLWNAATIFIVLVVAVFMIPKTGPIGERNMIMLFGLDGIMTLIFMYSLEKYSVMSANFRENCVITVLSCLYTFCVMCIINMIFFGSQEKAFADLIVAVVKVVSIFSIDALTNAIYNDENRFKKPRLLIIDSAAKNFARMKRIKYGVLKNYDSWYESMEGMSNEELQKFVKENFPSYDAICVLDGLSDADYHVVVNTAMSLNKNLFIVPKLIDVGKTNAQIVRFDDVLTLYMPKKSLSPIEFTIKRVLDLVLASIGLVIAFIPMVIIAIAIKLTSPGPIFYKQVRLTQNKKEFVIYKFRTMIPDAEKLSGPKFAEKNDPRITPIGKVLRAYRMDELPQIINILKGDMSIVGPRPERPVFVKQFEKEIENYNDRFLVKAGLTNLSHVYGRYSTYIHDRTYYDLYYITHYSIFLDLKIILLTVKILFLESAAEGEDDYKDKTVAKPNIVEEKSN